MRGIAAQLVQLAAALTVSLAAGLGWATVFGLEPVVVPVTVAVVVPVVLTAVLVRFTTLGLALRLLASMLVFLVVAAAIAESAPPLPSVLVDVLAGLRNGWRQILSSAPLAEPSGGPLVTAVAVSWLGAWGAAELTMRTSRVLVPLLPPLAGFAVSIGLGAGGTPLPRWVPALLTAACGVWLLVRVGAARGVDRFGLRRWIAGGATVAVAAVVAIAIGPRLPGAEARSRFDPRVLVDDPVVIRDQTKPLATLTAQVTGDVVTMFTARTDRPIDVNWRLAVLDRFEGNQWTSTSTFNRVGGTIENDQPANGAPPATRVSQRVALDGLDGWFLPAATRPVEVTPAGLATDDSGVLVVPADRSRPRSYTVVSSVVAVDDADMQTAVPAPGDPDAIPEPPEPVRRTALEITGAQRTAYSKLIALRNYFRDPASGFLYDNGEDAPTGNSYNAIETLLETRQGTAEQFASAFAVMAADLGYRSRVVVGYLPGTYDSATRTYTVTTHEAHAWPEVEFEGLGWVAFEPSPLERQTATDPEEEEATATTVPDPVPSNTQPEPGPPTTLPSVDRNVGGGVGRAFGSAVWVLVALIAVVVLAVLGIVAAKAARRQRRRQGNPAHRIAGPWREAVDRLAESGVDVPANAAASEVVDAPHVAEPATAPLRRLADIANRARFGGLDPAGEDAEQAWSVQEEVAGALRRGRSFIARGRMAVDPRPLLRRH